MYSPPARDVAAHVGGTIKRPEHGLLFERDHGGWERDVHADGRGPTMTTAPPRLMDMKA